MDTNPPNDRPQRRGRPAWRLNRSGSQRTVRTRRSIPRDRTPPGSRATARPASPTTERRNSSPARAASPRPLRLGAKRSRSTSAGVAEASPNSLRETRRPRARHQFLENAANHARRGPILAENCALWCPQPQVLCTEVKRNENPKVPLAIHESSVYKWTERLAPVRTGKSGLEPNRVQRSERPPESPGRGRQ
jgi:hypothetical protein